MTNRAMLAVAVLASWLLLVTFMRGEKEDTRALETADGPAAVDPMDAREEVAAQENTSQSTDAGNPYTDDQFRAAPVLVGEDGQDGIAQMREHLAALRAAESLDP